jgi:hypothetical protein
MGPGGTQTTRSLGRWLLLGYLASAFRPIPSQNLVSINPIGLRGILPINAAMPSSKTDIPIKECSFREFVPGFGSVQFGNEFSLSSRFAVVRNGERDFKSRLEFHCSIKRDCKQHGKEV